MKLLEDNIFETEASDVRMPDRSGVTNKGDCGRLLVVGGDRGMAGAPVFAAMAAYRSGTGLVELLTHPENRIPVQVLIPECVTAFWGEWDTNRLSAYSAISIGMGMGRGENAKKLLREILTDAEQPTVIDADALNIMSEDNTLFPLLKGNAVLTPHLGEFSRLTGRSIAEIKESTVPLAREFSRRHNVCLVLKDNRTHIAFPDGRVFVNTTGDSTLSKGGSGDILAGLIGSLLAQGEDLTSVVISAVYLHGKAGERAGAIFGQRGALARDVINEIPNVIKEY